MLLRLPDLLDAKQLSALRAALADAEFVDGSLTADGDAARVKDNLQLVRGSAVAVRARDLVVGALVNHREFARAALPKVVLAPLFCRYDPGMRYGPHRDAPIVGERPKVRTDVSVTVFLNDPTEYDGGDLVLYGEEAPRRLRGEAGSAVVYPSGALHEVTPVTRGTRLVAVTWVQSLVRSAEQRRWLYELATATERLADGGAETAAIQQLRACRDALLRMWTEP